MKRLLFPLLALVLLAITVTQVKASRQTKPVAPAPATTAAAPASIMAEGRVVTYPGAQVTVGSDVAGTIESIRVQEKDVVRRGDVLAVVRADGTRAALAEARSRVGEADADIRLFQLESERSQRLFREDVGSKQAWEKAERDIDAARARRASAVAEGRRLEAGAAMCGATMEGTRAGVTTRRLKPQDAAKPIDTRVLLVKVALAEATPLKLGQRVEVQIATR